MISELRPNLRPSKRKQKTKADVTVISNRNIKMGLIKTHPSAKEHLSSSRLSEVQATNTNGYLEWLKGLKPPTIYFEKNDLDIDYEIVSETLAHLLEKQQKHREAIKMYEQLILLYPKKKRLFAERITKIKGKKNA